LLGRCTGHSSTIKTLDWSDDSAVLRSTSNDYEMMYWNPRGKLIVGDDQANTRWSTWTSPLGFDVMGIYGQGMGGGDRHYQPARHCRLLMSDIYAHSDTGCVCCPGDINAVARSANQKWLAVADDSGLVRLLNYPCVVDKAPGYGHRGHASHIEKVGFLGHDYRVISCGGADSATYQWRIRGPGKPAPPPEGVDLRTMLDVAKFAGGFRQKQTCLIYRKAVVFCFVRETVTRAIIGPFLIDAVDRFGSWLMPWIVGTQGSSSCA
jgi:WD40 repeat protein